MVTDELNHIENQHPKPTEDDDDDNMTLENISIKSREEEGTSLSDDTESITLSAGEHTLSTTNDHHTKDTLNEEYQSDQQEDDDEEGRPSYKRMDLKGESESDKDLIIYSLNESLQIHKEIVERIQHEKDDLEERYERERIQEKLELQRETLEMQEKQSEKKQQLSKLEAVYQSLLNELELKKQDYKKMENKFQDYVKSIRATEDDLETIRPEINTLLGQINNLCTSIKVDLLDATSALLEIYPDLINAYFKPQDDEADDFQLDNDVISLMMEKTVIDIIVQDILMTPIHPGVPVNEAFGKIHAWVEKRNTSWAARMKQQICAFVVRPRILSEEEEERENEEYDELDKAKDDIVNKIMTRLDAISNLEEENNKENIQKKVTNIVYKAAKLNLSIKCQEIPVEILPVKEGVNAFDESIMKSVHGGDLVTLSVSPLFVAKDPNNPNQNHGFVIPAKVYCA